MQCLSILLFAGATVAGCAASHEGYLITTDTGLRSKVIFYDNSEGKRGSVVGMLANGEQCQGRFNTIPGRVRRSLDGQNPFYLEREDTQIGVAVLQCADSHVVKCDFTRPYEGIGSGHCLDNQGQKYSLSF